MLDYFEKNENYLTDILYKDEMSMLHAFMGTSLLWDLSRTELSLIIV